MADFVFPYTSSDLTEQVNVIPNTFGMINALNLFPSRPIDSTVVEVDRVNRKLRVLAAQPRGATGSVAAPEKSKKFFIEIPHIPHLDLIKPQDVQNQIGAARQRMTVDMKVAQKLAAIRRKHDITREYMRVQALKGGVKDGDGVSLFDPFTVFGITQKTVDFVLGTAGTDVIAKCEEVIDHIQTNIGDDTVQSVEMIVSAEFFNKFVQHAKVEKYWLQTQAAQSLANIERQRLGGSWGRVFEFQGILFREYKGSVPVKTGSERLVLANEAHAYPIGTGDTFETLDAPPHHLGEVNVAPTDQIFITTETLKHGEGEEMKSQSNPLPLATRPEVLVKCSTSN
jgi:hypothetical protein